MTQSCGTCRWIVRHLNADGQPVRLTGRNTYRCAWPMPTVSLPLSITSSYGGARLPSRRHMQPQEGETCPVWEKAP